MDPRAPNPELRSLMDFIGSRFPFDPGNYPAMQTMSREEQKLFAVKHSLLHLSKSVGVMATELENADHGGGVDFREIERRVVKILITSLNLARELNMSPEDIAGLVPSLTR